MTRAFWNILKVSPIVAVSLIAANSAVAAEVKEKITSVNQLSREANSIGQVTSVSQFSDVQPTDWAFQALQSLVERYGCIAGYPNGTYRGNRALTRYEFAAGLNACLDRVNELIATATADLVTKQDLATLQRLQEEFSAELATLRGRVDALEARTAKLEAQQFSTTTKLVGEAIFNVAIPFGDRKAVADGAPRSTADVDDNATFSDRVRLNLYSSFTGKDRLQIRLNAANITQFDGGSTSTTSPRPNITGTNNTRLGFDGDTGSNTVLIDKINYAFNFSDAIRVKVDATGGELNENVNVLNPDFASSGSGALSRYGRFSPIYRTGKGAGITVNYSPEKSPITFSASYLATNANNPSPNNGLFDGSNAIFGQLTFRPSQAFNIGLTYSKSYQTTPSLFDATGSVRANNPFTGTPRVESNNYGVQATFQPNPKLTVSGWFGYTTADALTGARGDADFTYWGATVGVKDFGREGNLLGVIFGQPPKVTGGSVGKENGTTYHLEGLYKVKVSDNIAVTPGLLVIFNPENNDSNDTVYVGTLRTTFTF